MIAKLEKKLSLDGKDIWELIAGNGNSPNQEIVHSLEVIRQGDWKFIEDGASYYGWKDQELQLYNIQKDPSETKTSLQTIRRSLKKLRARLVHHKQYAREGEPVSRIPVYPVIVYGEKEEARYSETLRVRLVQQKDL